MKILISGASGLIGSALRPCLVEDGHELIPLKRNGSSDSPSWDPACGKLNLKGPYDAVIHLSGENIAQRWTAQNRRRIVESRVDSTRLLCEGLTESTHPPRVLLSASAIGFYGDRGDERLVEESAPGENFLAQLVKDWEEATRPAQAAGVRVVQLRFGIVLSRDGGALKKLLTPFRFGLGGCIGHGRQFWSWISVVDLVRAVLFLLHKHNVAGPINLVSPNPVTNAEFTRTLARVLRRPAIFPIPAWAIKTAFGQMGKETLLGGARVQPARLLEAGFEFAEPQLEGALRHLLGRVASLE